MRWIPHVFAAVIVLFLSLIIYANRGLFFSRFDKVHWQDKYDHSQWKLPLSIRTLGDDGLYLYQGYRLIQGDDPTLLNAEVPPFGKYLIGAAIYLLGNGHWYGFIVTTLLIFVFYHIASKTYRAPIVVLGLTAALATDPLIADQYALTMLDSLQALMLLCVLGLLATYAQPKSMNPAKTLALGALVGLFAQTKVPLFAPVLFGICIWQIWPVKKRLHHCATLMIGSILGYLVPYMQFFLTGNSLSDWASVQKWILAFYAHSKLEPTIGSALANLLAGYTQNIFSRDWSPAPHWSPVWTLLLISSSALLLRVKSLSPFLQKALVALFIILGVYTMVPFWTRYLVLVLPILYLVLGVLLVKQSQKTATIVLTTLLVINVFVSVPKQFPTAAGMLSLFTYNWNNAFFSDLYEDLDTESRKDMSRTDFHRFGLQTTYDAEIEKTLVTYTYPAHARFTNAITVPVAVTYITRHLGEFTVKQNLTLHKEHNRWKVSWDWGTYIPGLSQTTKLVTQVDQAKRGSIVGSDKKSLAHDTQGVLVWITRDNIDPKQEEALLTFLGKLFPEKVDAIHFHQRIYGNSLPDTPIPVAVLPRPLSELEQKTLSQFSGVTLSPHLARFYDDETVIKIGQVHNTHYFECCSALYTTTSYDGLDGVEKTKNALLKGTNGGTLTLQDAQRAILQTLITREKKDGETVEP